MKTTRIFLATILFSGGLLFSSCEKEDITDESNEPTVENTNSTEGQTSKPAGETENPTTTVNTEYNGGTENTTGTEGSTTNTTGTEGTTASSGGTVDGPNYFEENDCEVGEEILLEGTLLKKNDGFILENGNHFVDIDGDINILEGYLNQCVGVFAIKTNDAPKAFLAVVLVSCTGSELGEGGSNPYTGDPNYEPGNSPAGEGGEIYGSVTFIGPVTEENGVIGITDNASGIFYELIGNSAIDLNLYAGKDAKVIGMMLQGSSGESLCKVFQIQEN